MNELDNRIWYLDRWVDPEEIFPDPGWEGEWYHKIIWWLQGLFKRLRNSEVKQT